MRAQNERLVLSLVRSHGALAKTDIARMTGLSAQTVSVIMRALEDDGLLVRREKVRGKVGQPLVPMALAPDGAYFLGLKIGRRSTDLMLMDFIGQTVGLRRHTYPYPTPGVVMDFVAHALPELAASLPADRAGRIAGIGIAMPFQLWNWAQFVGAPQAEMDAWRHRDIQAEIATLSGLPTYIQNDATAACGAELIFGREDRPADFLHLFIAHFIGGGLVLNGKLHVGPSGNAAAVASLPVPRADGGMHQLINVGSLARLEHLMRAGGHDARAIWDRAHDWPVPPQIRRDWIAAAAAGIAHAALTVTAVVDIRAMIIDGWLPLDWRLELVSAVRANLQTLDFSGIEQPDVVEGTIGDQARTLGAASIPLSQRFLAPLGSEA
ncbi:ROK family transcriptional regulator [Fuscibacter oryzae]|uniref:ROK family transcriptional regulator n=1 Tax=Fuscibacter oryzae TaxID=2803939 RepID=A0A8J7MVB4_9RHOB|nr:ROK family transcriptional regulator [Fuscibacter oryzae]MBL4928159.1 ROK family transcriptional regulator [Fuscibacter oryzae]